MLQRKTWSYFHKKTFVLLSRFWPFGLVAWNKLFIQIASMFAHECCVEIQCCNNIVVICSLINAVGIILRWLTTNYSFVVERHLMSMDQKFFAWCLAWTPHSVTFGQKSTADHQEDMCSKEKDLLRTCMRHCISQKASPFSVVLV